MIIYVAEITEETCTVIVLKNEHKMAEKNSSMKVWFVCFLLLSMVAFSHSKVDGEIENTETNGVTGRRLFNAENDKQRVAENPYRRGCSTITRCRHND